MSGPHNEPASNVAYDPLPLTSDDQHTDALYNAASPLPSAPSTPATASPGSTCRRLWNYLPALPSPVSSVLPLYNEGGPVIRDSYHSQGTFPSTGGRDSEYSSSVYALNDTQHQNQGSGGFEAGYRDDPRDTEYYGGEGERGIGMAPRNALFTAAPSPKRKVIIAAGAAAAALLILAIVIPVYFACCQTQEYHEFRQLMAAATTIAVIVGTLVRQPTSTGKPTVAAVTGGDGSKITTEDGTQFTYSNSFGGYWYYDPNDPFNNGARPQSWSPALNETFNYGVDRIRGVNLGGWLTIEPFMRNYSSPALFEPFADTSSPAVDEYTLHTLLAADSGNGGLDQIKEHYQTFITEQDFAEIAGAGLNYVRIPLPYWAIETRGDEPFLPKVAWTYFLKAIEWCRKYGLRINLDFHALPGSQNGWNHSGKLGTINFLNGPMGYANAQRSLDYIRIFAEFISQPQYRDVVTMFGIANEVQGSVVGEDQTKAFYLEAYDIVRNAGGVGEGKGPWWSGFLPDADRITLDSHPYITYATTPCTTWGSLVNGTMSDFGLANAGEFSLAVTDCGEYLNGVNLGTRYEGNYTGYTTSVGSCTEWTDWKSWDADMKSAMKQFSLASMDALQDWFFWTWKIGNSSISGQIESPAWSYQLGLQQGWLPKDPRDAVGTCGNSSPWTGTLSAGSGSIPASVSSSLSWPPATISNGGALTLLPSYTPTGVVPTLPAQTVTASATASIDAGDGWNNSGDKDGLMVNISSCSYLDPWVGPTAAPPSPLCS
ncbi:exo-beta-1,3-glucanase [Desarmillaria tabescens]|uniref:glucan 1,3-beta-glucosidase n=1 Tax=Armillaria tabescens TaxID=1929756 RepID=A0AA39KGN6_ARMTA|nr:exo-beta-1,3-glucanase [Desarmillaria tabescens]KAK0458473.1 exo-beta-1,3-glucanase [Desarmillaria tabescens]